MYHDHLQVVKSSLAEARSRRSLQELGNEMLAMFLEQFPEAATSFDGYEMDHIARHKFLKVADALVDVLEYPDFSESSLDEEVFRHKIHHEVKDKEYYFALTDALVATLRNTLSDTWNDEMEESWADTVAGLRHNVDLGFQEHFSS